MTASTAAPAFTIGVSLKMYFSHARTLAWASAVADIARTHPAVTSGRSELFVLPTFPTLVQVRERLRGSGVRLGAQDLAWADQGAYTGEVSGAELAEIGVDLAEIGHAERIRLFHEDTSVIAGKVHAAFRNRIQPLICVGETQQGSPDEAIALVTEQLGNALRSATADGLTSSIIVAYEPVWAIGAAAPAPATHIIPVLDGIHRWLANRPDLLSSRVVYGGSAGPGLLTRSAGGVRGLFLGRFAHDPSAISAVLDETLALELSERTA